MGRESSQQPARNNPRGVAFYIDAACSTNGPQPQIHDVKEEKDQIDREFIKALRQTEDELTKETEGGIVYLEVDGTNIHLQHEEKNKAEHKLGIISKGKERRYKQGKGEAKKL